MGPEAKAGHSPRRSSALLARRALRPLWLLAAVAALGVLPGACGGASEPAPPAAGGDASATAEPTIEISSPEITGIEAWLNGGPTLIREEIQNGRIVLVDFWTYTCVNCIRTFPHLRAWHDKYAEKGLTIIGVHSPEFEFEKELDNVRGAVRRHDIGWPVALDNNMDTWDEFENRFWPAKYLIDRHGEVIYEHFGEGAYEQTEQEIRNALASAGADLSDVPYEPLPPDERDPEADTQTREIYGGYERNYSINGVYAAQDAYYDGPDETRMYVDSTAPDRRRDGQFYLHGLWTNSAEAIVHARETTDYEDHMALTFSARSVNVVINPRSEDAEFPVVVELDGRPLGPEEAGEDIEITEEGRSIVQVSEPRMYKLVELPEFRGAELKLRANSDDFAVFAFTFGTYTEGF